MYLRTRSILRVPQLLTLLLVYQASIFIRLSNTVVNATSGVPETTLSRCDSSLGCSRMRRVISGLEKAMQMSDGKGTEFPGGLNARPKYHRPSRQIRRQLVRTSSVRGAVAGMHVLRRSWRRDRRMHSNFPLEPLMIVIGCSSAFS